MIEDSKPVGGLISSDDVFLLLEEANGDVKLALAIRKRNLARLQVQKAQYGDLNLPLEIANRIDSQLHAIKELETLLENTNNGHALTYKQEVQLMRVGQVAIQAGVAAVREDVGALHRQLANYSIEVADRFSRVEQGQAVLTGRVDYLEIGG